MEVTVQADYFTDRSQVIKEIESFEMHAAEMDVPPVKNDSHWHEFSTRIYILEGELNITDSARNRTYLAGPGAMVEVPARVLHAEDSADGYNIIAGLSIDPASLSNPVNLDPDLL